MIIIIEGADGTGKTALAKKLCEELNAEYIHATWNRELDSRMVEYQMGIVCYAAKHYSITSCPVIIDRLWLSEAVYGQIFRSGSKMPWLGAVIDRWISCMRGFNIICLSSDLKAHKDRFEKLKENRSEMYDDVTKVVELYNKFWFGGDSMGLQPGYMREIIDMGGANRINGYVKYEIEKEGQDLFGFVNNIVEKLKENIHGNKRSIS